MRRWEVSRDSNQSLGEGFLPAGLCNLSKAANIVITVSADKCDRFSSSIVFSPPESQNFAPASASYESAESTWVVLAARATVPPVNQATWGSIIVARATVHAAELQAFRMARMARTDLSVVEVPDRQHDNATSVRKTKEKVEWPFRSTEMIRSCITVSLVEEARGGPFVFWDGVADACQRASQLGFDAVEIFPPSAEAIDASEIRHLLDSHGLQLAALGTGAGWVRQKLSLTNKMTDQRAEARSFVRSIIDAAGTFHACAIIGSMQGRWGDGVDRETARKHLADSLEELGDYAKQYNVPLIYEPLNRYETNLCNTMADGASLLESLSTDNVVLLADLFHMNIEEVDIAAVLEQGERHIGHVHFVDSNRRPAGLGHMDYPPIVKALKQIGYDGYLSAEAFPYPDSQEAARQTMEAFRKHFR